MIELNELRDKNGLLIAENQLIRKPIPTQLDDSTAATIAVIGDSVGTSLGTQFSLNMVLSILMNVSLNALISSIKSLQIITHLLLIPLIVPANAQIFFNYISAIVAFDPVDIQDWVDDYFELVQSDEAELASNFVQLGYESSYYLSNLGSLLLIYVVQVAVILLIIMLHCSPVNCPRVKRWSSN